jgi:hypothetical protein
MGPRLPTCQNSHSRHSFRPFAVVGMNWPDFCARWIRMAPDSNTGSGPSGAS